MSTVRVLWEDAMYSLTDSLWPRADLAVFGQSALLLPLLRVTSTITTITTTASTATKASILLLWLLML